MARNGDLSTIVRAAIHPAIGIARIGNSPTDWFYGPEVDEPPPQPPGFYRDANGAIKRQAARFRIYGYDAQDNVVAELVASNAQIAWSAHLANRKAAWYEFEQALDLPESAGISSPRRNAGVIGDERASLVIDAGLVAVSGTDAPGQPCAGTFCKAKVYLGELRSDADGRLVVLGGLGRSFSPANAGLENFANNDGWCDDISDGPVYATVSIAGKAIPVDPAWVAVAPPDYAPNLKTVRTLYDLLDDLFNGPAQTVSFTRDVAPVFRRMSALQWVNFGFLQAFGYASALEMGRAGFLQAAAQKLPAGDPRAESRRQLVNAFRDLNRDGWAPAPLPWFYGDSISLSDAKTPHYNCAISGKQLAALRQWALGNYVDDYDPNPPAAPPSIASLPLAEQPAMLDRAALSFCLADAFHPGCELTWPMRHKAMYMAPFRLKAAPESAPEPDYGDTLSQASVLSPCGPLGVQWPGGLTRWMAVPWQTDTASCLSGYAPEYDPYLPTFWPARVPNHVLDEPEYKIAVDTEQPRIARIAAFRTRKSWPGVLPGMNHKETVYSMVGLWSFMGIIEQAPGVPKDSELPPVMQVTKLPVFPPIPIEPGPVISPEAHGRLYKTATAPAAAAAPSARPERYAPSEDGTFMGRFPRGLPHGRRR